MPVHFLHSSCSPEHLNPHMHTLLETNLSKKAYNQDNLTPCPSLPLLFYRFLTWGTIFNNFLLLSSKCLYFHNNTTMPYCLFVTYSASQLHMCVNICTISVICYVTIMVVIFFIKTYLIYNKLLIFKANSLISLDNMYTYTTKLSCHPR